MNKQTISNLAMVFIIAIAAVMLSLMFINEQSAQAAFAPTPVANLVNSDDQLIVPFQTQTALAADTNTSGRDLLRYEWCDLQTTVDVGTVNTTTFTVQFSNDNTNWDDGPAILSNVAADVTDMSRLYLFGRYSRIKQDLTNTQTLTTTLLAVCK